MKSHELKHHNRIELLNWRIDISQKLLIYYWLADVLNGYRDNVVVTAIHLLNRMPWKVLSFKTALQVLSTMFLPSFLLIPPRVFESVAFVYLRKIDVLNLNLTQFIVFIGLWHKKKKGISILQSYYQAYLCHHGHDFHGVWKFFLLPASNSSFQGRY